MVTIMGKMEGFRPMRLSRDMKWIAAGALCTLAAASIVGCTASASLSGGASSGAATAPEPPPPPPPPDNDGDGILDPDDKCPDQKEDKGQPDPQDGCPNLDADGDGVNTPDDKCPDKPETKNGFEDGDGCPDEKPLAEVVGSQVVINEMIQFKKDSHEIEDSSMRVVQAVKKVMADNPGIELVEVGGHASTEGDEWYNRTLTGKRAGEVVKKLVELGVEKERLIATGYGFYCPRADEGQGREKAERKAKRENRRVEFKILYRDGKRTDEQTGCEAAKKKGVIAKVPAKVPWTAKK